MEGRLQTEEDELVHVAQLVTLKDRGRLDEAKSAVQQHQQHPHHKGGPQSAWDSHSIKSMESTLESQVSMASLEESHASTDRNSSVMSIVSKEGHHQVLTYLDQTEASFNFGHAQVQKFARPPSLGIRPGSASMVEQKLRKIRLDMTIHAVAGKTARINAPKITFSKPRSKNASKPRTPTGRPPVAATRRTIPLIQTFKEVPPIEAILPSTPGRKVTIPRKIEDTILALRRRLSDIDAECPPSMFPSRKARFHDFAKEVMSPMISTENSRYDVSGYDAGAISARFAETLNQYNDDDEYFY